MNDFDGINSGSGLVSARQTVSDVIEPGLEGMEFQDCCDISRFSATNEPCLQRLSCCQQFLLNASK